VFILRLECDAAIYENLVADLWELGVAGITEEEAGGRVLLSAFFDAPFDASLLAAYSPRWEQQEDQDWVAVSRAQWRPVLAGRRFHLVPEWIDDPTPPGRLRLVMRPAQACGTGWHATTQLCLEAMESYLAPGAPALDLGTGSGILAEAASLLGAGRIYACDIDPGSAAEAAARLRREGIAAGVFAGSSRSIRDAVAGLVIANINAETLVALASELRRILQPGGALILSGFPERDLDRVLSAYGAPRARLEKDGWLALIV
jgi:ribosomal protein L11 methyltransferase